MEDIVKTFPGGVTANDEVTFSVERGEIHALLGENGAGKSTLMNVLTGLYQPDSGRIEFDGDPADFGSPRDAIETGIGMVHQHFMLIPRLSVVDNVILGERESSFPDSDSPVEPLTRLLGLLDIDRSGPAQTIEDISDEYGIDVNPEKKVWRLGVGEQQRIEIIKALYRDVDLLILDEPTAVLSPEDAERLFDTLQNLVDEGLTVIFISHKLDEITGFADRVTILRDGRIIDTVETADVTRSDMASMMVGEEVILDIEKETTEVGEPVLDVRNLEVKDDRGLDAVNGVDLAIREGEIVGIAGVSGNGQKELAEALAGLRDVAAGTVTVSGNDLEAASPKEFIDQGVSFIPEDRMKYGITEDLSVMHNLVMKDIDTFGEGKAFDYAAAREHAESLIDEYNVKVPNSATPIEKLSGGNIQKVILARELSRQPTLLIANQPTRGVDVGAIESIRNTLLDQCADGTGILLISEELDEVLQMSDRILVIHDGEIVHEVAREEADRDRIGQYMAEGAIEESPDGDAPHQGGVAN